MIRKALFMIPAAALVLGASLLWAQDSGRGDMDKAAQFSKNKDVSEPVLVSKVDPKYPAGAKQEKVEGTVVLDVKIGTDGSVLEAKASKSADPRLSEAAISAVKQWKYKPALNKAGKPVEVLATITVNFKLK